MFSPQTWRPAPLPFAWGAALPAALLLGLTGMVPIIRFGALLQFGLAGVLAVGLLALGAGRLDRGVVGLGRAPVIRCLLVGLAGLAVFYGGMSLIGAIKGDAAAADQAQAVQRLLNFGKNPRADLMMILLTTLIAPIVEEIIFRGLLFRGLRDGLTRGGFVRRQPDALTRRLPAQVALLIALAVSAWAFIDIHGGDGQDGLVLEYGLFATVMALGYHLSGSLIVPMVLHSIVNTTTLFGAATAEGAPDLADGLIGLIVAGPVLVILVALLIGRLLPRAQP
ncbi:lysostaphin resistance A-like protein [Paracoccus sp. p4-l81]|uniref:CPBP family intramembrane glutamic endopeptidase n=1 Tax=Paracoccus sp. p4-l81 TaxID=3342806 RepID=UPI0035BA6F81